MIFANRHASPQAQVKYLSALVRTQGHKIRSLELKLEAHDLDRKREALELENQIEALKSAMHAIDAPAKNLKRRWFNGVAKK